MKFLRELKDLNGLKVLLRLDFNVPIEGVNILDDFRIKKVIPTIRHLQEKGSKIIIISHIETPKDSPSLNPVYLYLKKIGIECFFLKNYKNALFEIEKLPFGGIIILENLREHEGEKKNDKKFAKELASLGDIYVNEAFAVSHRSHASVSAITEFIPSYAGFLFEDEIKHLSTAFNPDNPSLFILGGAKFETKLPLIEKFINIFDKVFVGGALANNFFKEDGKEIGKSLVSPENFNLSRFVGNPRLMLPSDSVINDDMILDVGQKTVELLIREINKAKYILWNGPLGEYEKGYKKPTLEIAKAIAETTQTGVKSVLGGGDTIATIRELDIENRFTFVSTGGGAMLEFLADGTLPGIEALERG